jgi:hypothetical protein
MIADMHRKIYRSIQIVVTEAWTVVWDEDAPRAEAGSHLVVWEDGQPGPQSIVLRRQPDGAGWVVEAVTELTES